MVDATLSLRTLRALKMCRLVALDNLSFYEGAYYATDPGPDKDAIGRAMAQKQAFLSAIDAIMMNHGVDLKNHTRSSAANDYNDDSIWTEVGEHLKQEEKFQDALLNCLDNSDDEILTAVIEDHLEAADIAVTALKATSLKL